MDTGKALSFAAREKVMIKVKLLRLSATLLCQEIELLLKRYFTYMWSCFSQGMTGSMCNERLLAKYKVSLKEFSSFDKLTTQHFALSD